MEKIKKVTFTSTGENRCPKKGEWFEDMPGTITLASFDFSNPKNIYVREVIEEQWKPKAGDMYFYINFFGGIENTYYVKGYTYDDLRFESGNCFRTRESAEAKLKEIQEILLK
jgi:hypothetical protein